MNKPVPVDLELAEGVDYVRIQGAKRVEIELEYVRDLTPEDLILLSEDGRGREPQSLQTIRDSHHNVAQLLASGLRPWEVSAQTGISVNRISILCADPTFNELLEHYRAEIRTEVKVAAVNLTDRMLSFATDAVQELHRRLDETPDDFSIGQLTESFKVIGDRAGLAPVTKSINVNVDMADRLAKARQRAGLEPIPAQPKPKEDTQ